MGSLVLILFFFIRNSDLGAEAERSQFFFGLSLKTFLNMFLKGEYHPIAHVLAEASVTV